jgi:predicted RNA-binding protein YlqC (UPF0109 family)
MKHELSHPISKTLAHVVAGICYHPEELKVSEKDHGSALEIRMTPHMGDFCIIIGKGGRQSRAIRYVATTMGFLKHKSVDVQFDESYVGDRHERREFKFNQDYTLDDLMAELNPVLELAFDRPITVSTSIQDGKFKILLDVKLEEVPLVTAISDMFYPFGRTHGRIVEIKTLKFSHNGQPR